MRHTSENLTAATGSAERCESRVWSGACDHGDGDSDERYLCEVCATVTVSDHEVRHEIYPHISGDYKSLY